MRIIRLIILMALSLALVTLALANRQLVELRVLPFDFFTFGSSLSLPLFVIILLGVLIGLLLGFFWEYLREHKHRRELSLRNKEIKELQRKVKELKVQSEGEQDEILALLEEK